MLISESDGTASLCKALDILDAVAASPAGLSHAELSRSTALARTTLYRILATLVERGMLWRDPQRRVYQIGMKCFALSRQACAEPDLAVAASLELRNLRDLTGETSYLAVQDGLDMLALERCEGAHGRRSAAALGQRKPMYCTSQGKAILAALKPEARRNIVQQLQLKPLTPLTITDKRRLYKELDACAQRGYAIDDEEITPEVRCVGAAIVDGSGVVRGAISIAGPTFRLSRRRLELLGPEVAEAARRIGAQLHVASHEANEPVEVLAGTPAMEGRLPYWDEARQCWYWIDTRASAIRRRDADGERELATFDAPVLCMALHNGKLLAGCAERVWVIDPDSGEKAGLPWRGPVPMAWGRGPDASLWACIRLQEAAGDARWAVGMWDETQGFLPAWSTDTPITGLAWDGINDLLYCLAPATGTVYRMQPGDPQVRRFASVVQGAGELSGIAVDGRGGVWVALRHGWNMMRYERDGNLDKVVGLPVPQPTGLALSGDAQRLLVTSARHGMSPEELDSAPLSGQLLLLTLAGQG